LSFFSLWGIPERLVTDNRQSLCSKEVELFLKKIGVAHIKTSPYNPSSNGAAENVVRTFKNFFKKNKSSSDIDVDIFKFMLSYKSTTHCSTGVSPAELQMGRRMNTIFDKIPLLAKEKYNKCLEEELRGRLHT